MYVRDGTFFLQRESPHRPAAEHGLPEIQNPTAELVVLVSCRPLHSSRQSPQRLWPQLTSAQQSAVSVQAMKIWQAH